MERDQRQREEEFLKKLRELHASDEHFVEEARAADQAFHNVEDTLQDEAVERIRNNPRMYHNILTQFLNDYTPIAVIAAGYSTDEDTIRAVLRITNKPCSVCGEVFVASTTMVKVNIYEIPFCKQHRLALRLKSTMPAMKRHRRKQHSTWLSPILDDLIREEGLRESTNEAPEVIKAPPKPGQSNVYRVAGIDPEEKERELREWQAKKDAEKKVQQQGEA